MPQRHKGDRVYTPCRPLRAVRESLEVSAREAGFDNVGDYVCAVLAEHEGLPQFAPAPRRTPEESPLPLSA